MRLRQCVSGIGLLICCVILAGCGYEEGFEYSTEAQLSPLHGSGVSGTIKMGYGIRNPTYRLRIALHGLSRKGQYQLRLSDAKSCDDNALAQANRIDALRDDPTRKNTAWGFISEPIGLSGNFVGNAEQEFIVSPPTAPSIYGNQPDKYPTAVIYAPADGASSASAPLERVGCGSILSIPTNHRPHT